jgi:SDR family mycofactocin-dependent oxidoreductase
MGKLDGRVAFITGVARGQGRNHAVRLAREGAAIVGVDICAQIDTVAYPMSTPDDLEQTVKEVEHAGGRILARQADVRDAGALASVVDEGVTAFGPIGIVLANAGIGPGTAEASDREFEDAVAVDLNGVYHTVRAATPSMIDAGAGGAIVITSSMAGLVGAAGNDPGLLGYTAAKHGVIGLMKSWANFLAPHSIRVNCLAPTGVRTPMVVNEVTAMALAVPDNPLVRAYANALPVDMVEPDDISNAVLYLVSDEGRYVTGTVLPVDAGSNNRR